MSVENSVEADMAEAMAELGGEAAPVVEQETAPEKEAAESTEAEESKGPGRDEKGRFAKNEKPAEKVEAKPEPVKTEAAPAVKPAPVAPVAPKFRPPASWKPSERERFTEVPEWAQEIIDRREREIQQGLQQTAEPRKFYDSYKQRLGQHETFLRQLAPEPVQALESLVGLAQTLRMGSPADRARAAFQVLTENNVDVELVNQLLSGAQPAAARQVDPDSIARQVRQQIEREQATKQQEQLAAQWEAFRQSSEFADDVKGEMAAALSSGRAKTYEEAYKFALRLHEADDGSEVGKVLRSRSAATKAKESAAAAEKAKRTAISVKSSPSNIRPVGKSKGTVEDDIRQVLEEMGG